MSHEEVDPDAELEEEIEEEPGLTDEELAALPDGNYEELTAELHKEVKFTIPYNGKAYRFIKKELSWSALNQVLSKSTKVLADGKYELDMDAYFKAIIQRCIVKSFQIKKGLLHQVPPAFGALLKEHLPSPQGAMGDDPEIKK